MSRLERLKADPDTVPCVGHTSVSSRRAFQVTLRARRAVAYNSASSIFIWQSTPRWVLLTGDCTMRRSLSLPGLAVAAWASCLGLLGLLAGMILGRAWHPHFLPATTMLLLGERTK